MVVLGDIHLADLIWHRHRQITGDARIAFTSFIDIAIQLSVPAVIAGDLFDVSDPPSSLVQFFRSEMERAHQAGIPVYAIQGNHDKRAVPWYVACSPYPIHFGDGKPIAINGINVVGFDYTGRDEIQAQLAQLVVNMVQYEEHQMPEEKPRILFLHQAVKQALKFEGAYNCDLDWVPSDIPLTILGDIHKTMRMPMEHGEAWYTGASHARNIDEAGTKFCLGITKDLKVEPIEIDHRRILKAVWPSETDVAYQFPEVVKWATAAAAESIPELPPVVWLRAVDVHAGIISDLKHALSKIPGVILIEDPLVEGEVTDLARVTIDTSDLPSVPELLARIIDPKEARFTFQLITDLLDPTADIQERLAAQKARFMASRQTKAA